VPGVDAFKLPDHEAGNLQLYNVNCIEPVLVLQMFMAAFRLLKSKSEILTLESNPGAITFVGDVPPASHEPPTIVTGPLVLKVLPAADTLNVQFLNVISDVVAPVIWPPVDPPRTKLHDSCVNCEFVFA
jgi:hypothetical protein